MEIEYEGLNFELDKIDRCAAVIKGNYTGDITIPDTVIYEGVEYYVSAISESAFEGAVGLLSLKTPASMRAIGARAFKGCTALHTVN